MSVSHRKSWCPGCWLPVCTNPWASSTNSSMAAEHPVTDVLPDFSRLFDRPVIILAAPRSGSTLLFETLSECADLWTIGGESHQVIESIPALNPASGKIDSNRLTAEHAAAPVAEMMRRRFARLLRDRDGREFFR